MPAAWMDEPDEVLATVIDIFRARNEAVEAARRKA